MADTQYLDDEAGGIGLLRLQQVVNLTGAAVSVALVVGVALWGYRLAVRDVAGIPVVQALDEPMRIAPVDPGGQIAGHIGLSVNAIAAEGTTAPPPDQLVLAPRPVELAAEDLPTTAALPAPVTDPAGIASSVLSLPDDAEARVTPLAPVETPTQAIPAEATDLTAEAAADAEGAAVDAAGTAEPPVADQVEPLEPAEVDPLLAPEPEGTLVRSLRPMRRPTEMVVLASLATVTATPVEATPVAAAAIASGTRMVQLGAFDNEADAMAEWTRLVAQFGDLISGKSRVIQDAQSGGRNFVRLRAMGFADEADARRFCSALLSENAVCVPVAQR
jgi:cell division protein FtsN